jgi:hypothetical protein
LERHRPRRLRRYIPDNDKDLLVLEAQSFPLVRLELTAREERIIVATSYSVTLAEECDDA